MPPHPFLQTPPGLCEIHVTVEACDNTSPARLLALTEPTADELAACLVAVQADFANPAGRLPPPLLYHRVPSKVAVTQDGKYVCRNGASQRGFAGHMVSTWYLACAPRLTVPAQSAVDSVKAEMEDDLGRPVTDAEAASELGLRGNEVRFPPAPGPARAHCSLRRARWPASSGRWRMIWAAR